MNENRKVVGVSDMVISSNPDDTIITHALGSCIGITIYDPQVNVGALLHFQLPSSKNELGPTMRNPFMYADTGIPTMFKEVYKLGAKKHRIVVKVAGGGKSNSESDMFEIGRRNYIYMRKIFWKNNVLISGEHIGNNYPITMQLEIGTGKTFLSIKGNKIEL